MTRFVQRLVDLTDQVFAQRIALTAHRSEAYLAGGLEQRKVSNLVFSKALYLVNWMVREKLLSTAHRSEANLAGGLENKKVSNLVLSKALYLVN